jgi:hypothetical protein
MTPIADMVEAMLAKGMPADVIVLAVRTVELAAAKPEADTRSGAAVRQARYRDRKRNMLRNSYVTSVTQERVPPSSAPPAPSPPLYINPPSTPPTSPPKPPPRERASRATRLPADWKPTEEDWTFAVALLMAAVAREELAKFCDYWKAKSGKDATKADWSATWRNWCRKASEIRSSARGPPRAAQPLTYREQKQKAWDDARQALRESIERDEQEEREARGREAGGLFPALGSGE